ncbi:MAG: hypothetical protein ABI897_08155 [Spartobacteria bacterium]
MRLLSPFRAILIGGAIAGILDITYAIGFSAWRGVAPLRLLQSVASGLLGAPAFEGGLPTAALGLFLHFCIALLWATIFYFASKATNFPARHPVVAGLFFGMIIFAVMNLVVLPLSAFPRKVSFQLVVLVTGILVHMFCIGLPISLAVRRTRPAEA